MKLCFISPGQSSVDVLNGYTNESGGAEAQIAYLASAFVHLGHKVDLIFNSQLGQSSSFVNAGVSCIDTFPSWKHPKSLLKFWAMLKKTAADLIYARLPSDFLWVIGLYTKLHPKSRFIYAFANDRDCNPWRAYNQNSWLHNPLYALGLRMADIIAIQHEAQEQIVKNYVNGKLVLIPNLVRFVAQNVRNFDNTDIDVIWIAQIRPQKQLSVLLDIAEVLSHLQFVVVGSFFDNSCRAELERRIKSLKNLSYLGSLDHDSVMQLLVRSRVLANTSYWEGFPNTMLEAWSLGVPVVSFHTNPGNVICREGLGLVSGTCSQMVKDIVKLVNERNLNLEIGEKGQQYVRRVHSIEAVCNSFEKVMPGFRA